MAKSPYFFPPPTKMPQLISCVSRTKVIRNFVSSRRISSLNFYNQKPVYKETRYQVVKIVKIRKTRGLDTFYNKYFYKKISLEKVKMIKYILFKIACIPPTRGLAIVTALLNFVAIIFQPEFTSMMESMFTLRGIYAAVWYCTGRF